MSDIGVEEANQVADLLNQICSATIEALQADDVQRRLAVAGALRDLQGQFEEMEDAAQFVTVLVEWLEGARPTTARASDLGLPFQRVLDQMMQQVPQTPESPTPAEPISRRVLAQLVSAVVAAEAAHDSDVQRKLAVQLVNIQNQLSPEWRSKLGPLLENLRAVVGGADPRTLPDVAEPIYQQLWLSARELLLNADFSEEVARSHLLDRLVHNTIFTVKSDNAQLTESFLRSLLDVQRQALDTNAPFIATLVGAIRAYIQGLDPSAFSGLLEGEELVAWQQILEGVASD